MSRLASENSLSALVCFVLVLLAGGILSFSIISHSSSPYCRAWAKKLLVSSESAAAADVDSFSSSARVDRVT